jgi:thiol-disulfide isomerase/thioredoxin
VVDFWASWCAPCRLQARILGRLHEELGDKVQFLAVNLGEDRETIERYIADEAFSYPVLMDPEEQLGFGLEIYVLPTVMVLDRDGGITYFHQGISDRPRLTAALAEAGVPVVDERPS